MPHSTSLEDDLQAIRALNQRDVDAVLASDTETVMSQWSDDFVVIPPAGPIVRSRAANVALAQKGIEQVRAVEPLEYSVDFEEIIVAGDYAFEWGTYHGTSRPRAGGNPISYGGKLLRILQRQPDGSWKMHRTIATTDPPARAS